MSDDVPEGFQTYEDAMKAHLDAKNEQIADYRKQLTEKNAEIARLENRNAQLLQLNAFGTRGKNWSPSLPQFPPPSRRLRSLARSVRHSRAPIRILGHPQRDIGSETVQPQVPTAPRLQQTGGWLELWDFMWKNPFARYAAK